jgi:hypothetical protein
MNFQLFIYSLANVAYFFFACEAMIMSLIAAADSNKFHCELLPSAAQVGISLC